jgi:cell division protein FtsN
MAKDFPGDRDRGSVARPMNPMFLGILIGLLLGIIIALGVALWLNKSALPFLERAKPPEPLSRIETKPAPHPEPSAPVAEATPSRPEKSRFEFYQILPGEKDAAGKDARLGPKKPAEVPQTARPADKTADKPADKGGAKEVFYLQAGAFQSESDAENLKAKIAFIGLQASAKAVAVPDKGTLYRVRLGPYQSLEDVNRIKAVLSQNGVGANIVKTTDAFN